MQAGRWAEAAAIYEQLERKVTQPLPDRFRHVLANAYDLFERLDFRGAAARLDELGRDLERAAFDPLLERDEVVGLRERLRENAVGAARLRRVVDAVNASGAIDPARSHEALMSDECLDLAMFLIESARRRQRDGQYDLSALLAYRASEVVVQRRLAIRTGVDTAHVDPSAWEVLARTGGFDSVQALVAEYNRKAGKDEHYLDAAHLPRQISRVVAFMVLHVTVGDVARDVDLGRFAGRGEARNKSILAHGLAVLGEKPAQQMVELAEDLLRRALEAEGRNKDAESALRRRHEFVQPKT
jgi:hypothetical protein